MRPTVNRAVHFYPHGDAADLAGELAGPFAAIVTRVAPVIDDNDRVLEEERTEENDWKVGLAIFVHLDMSMGVEFSTDPVPFSPTPKPGCWTWPPRA